MTIPPSQPLTPSSKELAPARKRRLQRSYVARSVTDPKQREFLEDLAQRVKTPFSFFLYTLFCGVMLAVAICLDHPALYILAALLAPYMAPLIALGISTVIGSFRLLLRSLFSFILGAMIIFGLGAFTGWLAHSFTGLTLLQARHHAVLSWPDLLLLAVAVILTNILVVRSKTQRPLITSVALVYELYLPAGVAGFGLTSGVEGLWPGAAIVLAVHLGVTILLSVIVLAFQGLRMRGAFGYILVSLIVLAAVLAGIALSGVLAIFHTNPALSPVMTPMPSETPTFNPQPIAPSETPTPTTTLIPTTTNTVTLTPEATLAQAFIDSPEKLGAYVRSEPSLDAEIITSLMNGELVYILPEVVENKSITWAHVRLPDGTEGWIVRDLLATATPRPGW